MPLIRLHVRKFVPCIAAVTSAALLAGAGAASASCPTQPVSTPFSQWGDTGSYALVPGGSFEGTFAQVGWTLSDASLTGGNEPFFVNGASDGQSLIINGGGSATSPYFCVDKTMQQWRFIATQVALGSDLEVDVLSQNGHAISVADLADRSMPSWMPTQPIDRSSNLPNGNSVMVALRFTVPSSSGNWQLDDVYVDPYRSG